VGEEGEEGERRCNDEKGMVRKNGMRKGWTL